MAAPVLVTGGTGTLGRRVVARLREAGNDVRVLTRRRVQHDTSEERTAFVAGDLATGDGIAAAVDGVETIVHCAGSRTGDDDTTRNLVRAAAHAGARHLVFISVVGADRIPVTSRIDRALFGYFDSKRKAEQVVAESGIPWTTLRATQFHDLVLRAARALARLPIVPLPKRLRLQPVDADEVAARLVELALESPAGLVPDFAGPKVAPIADLFRSYLRVVHHVRPLLRVSLPGEAARAVRAGANLAPARAVGRRTWEDFLAARITYREIGRPVGARALRLQR